ncbi:MAG: hypothetical protein K5663_06005 [Clostridiales bacterium]|nr:hypothetical protein [Clostridiales bacterium]
MAKILPKKERTLDVYLNVGAQVRLAKDAVGKAYVALGKVLKADELAKVRRALDLLDDAVNKADSRMYCDHPEISGNGYTSVFYGTVGIEARSQVEKEVLRLAKKYADELSMTKR